MINHLFLPWINKYKSISLLKAWSMEFFFRIKSFEQKYVELNKNLKKLT